MRTRIQPFAKRSLRSAGRLPTLRLVATAAAHHSWCAGASQHEAAVTATGIRRCGVSAHSAPERVRKHGAAIMSSAQPQRRRLAAVSARAAVVLLRISALSLALARGAAGTTRSLEASSAAVTTATEREAAEFSYPIPAGHR